MVVNNDTGKEVKTIFKRVVPQVLEKNKVSDTVPTPEVSD